MAILVDWLAYPLLLAALTLGWGLLLERCCGRRLPGALLLPAGYAVLVVVSGLTTAVAATARLTTPLVLALAALGFGLGFRSLRRLDRAAALTALAVLAVYAAPIVLSGSATFAGYITLDDTATWLALADNALAHGRSIASLAPSTYSTVLHDYLGAGYPLGAFVPLGVGHQLVGEDEAWLFQPQIAFLAAMLGLSLFALLRGIVARPALRGLCAFLGAQAALLYGYAFWSGIKEVTAAALLALLAGLLVWLAEGEPSLRVLLAVAVSGAAILDVLAIVGVVWFAALGLLAAAGLASRRYRRPLGRLLPPALAATAVLALPALASGSAFLKVADSGDITSSGAAGLGNLVHPLSLLQVFGIWPVGDFRLRPSSMVATGLLIVLAAVALQVALVAALRRRAYGVPLYLAIAGGGALAVVALGAVGHGSAWLDGKALAVASPAFVAAAAAGAATLVARARSGAPRVASALVLAAVGGGVLWSNALAYGNVWLAPRTQLAELETIGQRFAGEGPALMTEYEPYGVRHFLRALDPEGASERRYRPVSLRSGGMLGKEQYADLDSFALGAVLAYRTLVLRTSPVESRPPSVYSLVWRGRYYEVWQRPVTPAPILEHLSLGTGLEPDAVPDCGAVRALAALAARDGGSVLASERPEAVIVDLGVAARPASWQETPVGMLVPTGPGSALVSVRVPTAGRYEVWLGGSFRDRVSITVDGVSAGTQSDQLSETDQLVPFGTVSLAAGTHTIAIRYTRSRLAPGSGSYPFAFGPLELGQPASAARIVDLAPARATALCGRTLDWIEAVGYSPASASS